MRILYYQCDWCKLQSPAGRDDYPPGWSDLSVVEVTLCTECYAHGQKVIAEAIKTAAEEAKNFRLEAIRGQHERVGP